jgi:predicted transcriptional regulator
MNNKPQQKTTVWSLRVPVALIRRVTRLADAESRTASNMARLLLESALAVKENSNGK